jgi:hypothetical protein
VIHALQVLAQRTQELTDAKRNVLRLQEQHSSLQQQLLVAVRRRDTRNPLLPVPSDTESIADSMISEGARTRRMSTARAHE